jgi:hypothetical protein
VALLIVFVAMSALVAGAIGAAVASGTTTGVIIALFVHLIGTIVVLGVTFGALGADGAE